MRGRSFQIFSMLALVLMLGACTNKDKGGVVGDGSLGAEDRVQVSEGIDSSGLGGVTPGTQQDLVVNVGDRIFFGYDQFDLTPEARGTVERQAQWMKTHQNVTVIVEGHCDERGTREYNLALGEKRAMAVRNYLIANGVAPNRVQTISYGKERPVILGSDNTSWAQNRRGVLVVQ
jgi:peptidoglycan-associated lipoprotein